MAIMVAVVGRIYLDVSTRLPMPELRRQAELIGLRAVESWSSMGNLVFDADGRSPEQIEDELETAVVSNTGFDVAVFVRTAAELASIVAADPFAHADVREQHQRVFFCSRAPEAAIVATLAAHDWRGTTYRLHGREVFITLRSGIGRIMGLFDRLERSHGLLIVERNWNTVLKLHDLVTERRERALPESGLGASLGVRIPHPPPPDEPARPATGPEQDRNVPRVREGGRGQIRCPVSGKLDTCVSPDA